MLINNILILTSIFISLLFCIHLIYKIMLFPKGNEKMIKISNIIELCAKVYLKRQYYTILIVSIIICSIIFFIFNIYYVYGFILGAFLSATSGYIGMLISVKANVRTTNAAKIAGLADALKISFKAGGITGLLVINFSLLSIFIFYTILNYLNLDIKIVLNSLLSLAFGASLISIFARLGGGIFTKAADIGGDLVGKLELGIPEDDFRNPATIADNVGDNVGDCAGMAADLYETCCVTNIAAMILISTLCNNDTYILLFPLILNALSIISTIIGIASIKLIKKNVMLSLYRALIITVITTILLILLYIILCFGWTNTIHYSTFQLTGKSIFLSSLIGVFLTIFLVITTEYYTSTKYSPVQSIAKISDKGHAPNIIQGLAISMESTAIPVILVIISILSAYYLSGIIGIAIAATSMVSLSGIIITLDAYGPITDNAGGIAEMAKLDEHVRTNTDILDSVGNTTKAITKGYAIGSAGLASLVLFITYTEDLKRYFNIKLDFSLENPFVICGLFFGGIIPYIFASFSMKAVGEVAASIVNEIRKQFSNINHLDDNFNPNYTKIVDLLTKASIKKMVLPSMLPIILPIFMFLIIYMFFDKNSAFISLGAMLLGTIITGIFLAISMTSGGGAWDNAKKYIESGNYGGKKSLAHQAAVTGDMVGDPYKDTAGPSINPLIKVSNIVSLFIILIVSKLS